MSPGDRLLCRADVVIAGALLRLRDVTVGHSYPAI